MEKTTKLDANRWRYGSKFKLRMKTSQKNTKKVSFTTKTMQIL